MRRTFWTGLALAIVTLGYVRPEGQETARRPERSAPSAQIAPVPAHGTPGLTPDTRRFLSTYCSTCHNDRARTGGLTLEGIDLANVGDAAEMWEKVVKKLQLRAMPPVGINKRPQAPEYKTVIADLESALDRAAVANPNPGRPIARRLTRTEYTNAIRDLLALEIDGAALLPPDNVGHGFDNIGSVLSVSPVLMERYMFAADRISRLAVGEAAQPATETYRVSHKLMQTDRMSEDLPFGSRGGAAIRHLFPADGEYALRVRLQRNDDGYIRGLRDEHRLDVRLNDVRVKLFTIGGERRGKSGPIWTGNQNVEYSGEPAQVNYEFTADEALEVRFPAKAGTHLVGVTFLKRRARPAGVLAPEVVFDDLLHYKGGEPAVESVAITGPFDPTGVSETPSRRRIFSCRPARVAEEETCATAIFTSLARRAYRRPPASGEIDDLLELYRHARKSDSFESAIRMGVFGMLAGPEFLFRIEHDPRDRPAGSAYRITDLALASRLSFFLWNSIPDEELLTTAERGRLSQPAVLEQQVRRMLSDARADSLVTNFASQWLSIRNLGAVEPDPGQFPDFDDELKQAFRQETEMLVGHGIRNDRSVVELLTADYTFVNERLARHYGIPNVTGSRFRRVPVTDEVRRGLLGHGSVLTVTSYAARTSPVLRGKWVLEQLLDMAPPPPPPDVPTLEERSKEGKALTMREAIEEHRKNPACASCHQLMDPIGFALEPFDAVGKFRTVDLRSQAPIDASGMLFDGSVFDGPVSLRRALMAYSEPFVQTAAKRLFTYALGRPFEYYDAPAIRKIVREAAPGGYRWSSLIMGIVKSDAFQMRRPDAS